MASTMDGAGGAGAVPVGDAGLGAFYRDMTPAERRTFWACAAG